MPAARSWTAAAVVGEKIYLIGGASGFNPWIKVSIVEIYDPKRDTWEDGVDLPDARGSSTSAVVAGKIYVIGGVDVWVNQGPPDSVVATVAVFDTGLAVSPRGRLATTWGEVKRGK
ncbi:hypothetical protein HYR99_31780 [Candidatus Poribacteria bacterium]|nr:hypothetical protein [Candidatus Poribacteria bacterium]